MLRTIKILFHCPFYLLGNQLCACKQHLSRAAARNIDRVTVQRRSPLHNSSQDIMERLGARHAMLQIESEFSPSRSNSGSYIRIARDNSKQVAQFFGVVDVLDGDASISVD